jgi:hypothetical protein
MRVKRSVQTLPDKYQVCSAAFADAGDQVKPIALLDICICACPVSDCIPHMTLCVIDQHASACVAALGQWFAACYRTDLD